MSAAGVAGGAATGAKIGSFGGPIGTGIGAGVGALLGFLTGRKGDKKNKAYDEQMKQLLQQQMARYQAQQPLRDAITQMAFRRMPAIYRQGMTAPGPTAMPTPTGDPMNDLLAMQPAQQQGQQPLYDVLQHLAASRRQGM